MLQLKQTNTNFVSTKRKCRGNFPISML